MQRKKPAESRLAQQLFALNELCATQGQVLDGAVESVFAVIVVQILALAHPIGHFSVAEHVWAVDLANLSDVDFYHEVLVSKQLIVGFALVIKNRQFSHFCPSLGLFECTTKLILYIGIKKLICQY